MVMVMPPGVAAGGVPRSDDHNVPRPFRPSATTKEGGTGDGDRTRVTKRRRQPAARFFRMVTVSGDAGMAFDATNCRLGRGISFGNALDTLREGDAGFRLRERYFAEVRDAGFDTVRLPVKWSAHAGESSPYTISPALFERVDWAIGEALDRGLNIVVNVHHYDELNDAPQEQRPRFLGLWRQIAARYAGWSGRLYFELLNEPRAAMTAKAWNELIPLALAVVRERDPGRAVIVGPARMNDIGALPELELPEDDRLVVGVHYYAPLEFTHQGAAWREGADQWVGTTWGDDTARRAYRRRESAGLLSGPPLPGPGLARYAVACRIWCSSL